MEATTTPPRRAGTTAVHSLHRFVFSVPDLDKAVDFYQAFGLDVRRVDGRVDLYTYGHPHRWGSIYRGAEAKRLEYVSFAAYPDDFEALTKQLEAKQIPLSEPHRLADEQGVWVTDPEGVAVQIVAGSKASPATKEPTFMPMSTPGKGAAPSRSKVNPVRPRRLSHVLLFSSNVPRSVRFYTEALGLRLSDHSGEVIAFLHGAHASDHHMLAFAKSDGPGLHHSSWDVATLDDVGLGMQQMIDRGYPDGWGVGRHVIGSNYFRYVRDPWGSFAEYSYDIDFIPADVEWNAADHAPDDSFYVWGPPVPDYFIVNHESAARQQKAA
ncbi:MAG TPA: VOC family protein [Casimicrobiaceae bacterium]|jgi:catechol 2,3-dioxygenase-like lactoylglutathione lyase family enzyme